MKHPQRAELEQLINELELDSGTVALSNGRVVCVNGKRTTLGLPRIGKNSSLDIFYDEIVIIEHKGGDA